MLSHQIFFPVKAHLSMQVSILHDICSGLPSYTGNVELQIYQERGVKDKERYKKEMEEYRGGLKPQTSGGGGDGDGGACGNGDEDAVPGMDAAGRPDHSMSSLSETDSLLTMEEEKLKSDVGTS